MSSPEGKKEINASTNTVLIDKITINNLPADKSYKVIGTLVPANEAGEEIDLPKFIKNSLTSELPIEIEDGCAEVNLTYELNTSHFPSCNLVSTVMIVSGDNECLTHYDLNDKNQTVKILQSNPIPQTLDKAYNFRKYIISAVIACVLVYLGMNNFTIRSNNTMRNIY